MTRKRCILRITALLSLGALGVHQGRYAFGYGKHADSALANQGHAYLSAAVTPVVIVLVALALARLLVRALEGPPGPARRAATSRRVLWLRSTAALLAIFVVQELAEGALAPGHPEGIPGVVGHGGWIALPLAVVVGAIVALALAAAEAVEDAGAAAGVRLEVRLTWPEPWRPGAAAPRAHAGAHLADHHAGRGPPLLCR